MQMINHQLNTLSDLGILSDLIKIAKAFLSLLEREVIGFNVLKYLWPFLLTIFFYSPPTFALDVTLQWDASGDANLAGYNLYYDTDTGAPYNGMGAQEGNSPVDVPLAQDKNPDPNIVEFTINNLPDGTYYFAVTAYNDEVPPLESDYSNVVILNSTPDTTAPVISNLQVASKTTTTAVIEWTTDELSDSVVQYGTGGIYYSGQSDVSMVTSHSINLTGLDPNTTYNYRVFSTDASGNIRSLSGMTFTTLSTPDFTPPIISNVAVVSKSHITAVIEWTTDEGSDSVVQYGTITSTWDGYPSNESNGSMVTSHSINLTGLLPGTIYYFRVGSTDASNNGPTTSNELSFTTNPPPDTTPPVISNVRVSSKTHNTALIEWTTDEQSDSVVQYGTSSNSWGGYPSSQSNGSMMTNHSLTLTGLNGSTTYYFRVGSTDGSGNGPTTSNQSSFTTDPTPDTTPPVLSNVQVASHTYNSAVITWTTNENSSSIVRYGTGSSSWANYPSSKSDVGLVTSHSVTLTGLNSSTIYYFRD
jgi:hypothetical protein